MIPGPVPAARRRRPSTSLGHPVTLRLNWQVVWHVGAGDVLHSTYQPKPSHESRLWRKSSDGHSVVFDIGAGELSIVFADNANCEYFRNRIRFSTKSAANTLADAIGLSNEAAESLLLYWGVGGVRSNKSTELEKLIAQHLTRWLQQLVYEIRRTLNFLNHRFGANSNCELLLCGGGANIRGLPELLTTELGTRVQFAGPSVAWSWKSAEPYSPIYAQALSLATYGVAI